MKTRWLATIALLTLTGCASPWTHEPHVSAASRAAAQRIAQAQAAVKKTAAMAALWTTTAQDLKKAKHAQATGDYAEATALANEVIKQTVLAQAQAQSGANVKPVYGH